MTKYSRKTKLSTFKKALSVFVLVVITITTITLVSKNPFYSQPQETFAAGTTCKAKDPSSLKACIIGIQSGTVSTIEITATISCQNATTCDFLLDGIRRPVTIRGTAPKYGITRSKAFNYSFRVANSDGITFQDLTFKDDSGSCDPLNESLCAPMILFNDSTNITVDRLTMTKAKRSAIAINATQVAPLFTIQNSTFTAEEAHAITTNVQGGVGKIINNTFSDTASNAIAFNVKSTQGSPSIIQGNIFTHNHKKAIYKTCGSTGKEPCPGGQLYFEPGAENVLVTDNIFKNGYADVSTANSDVGVAGIEVMHNRNRDISIMNNMFLNNSTGIMINYESDMTNLTSGIVITANYFTANKKYDTYFFNYPTTIDISRNNYQGFAPTPASGTTTMKAWWYEPKGLGTIKIYVDGSFAGNAQLTSGITGSYSDISHIYQVTYPLQTTKYSNGIHKIKITGLGSDITFSSTFQN